MPKPTKKASSRKKKGIYAIHPGFEMVESVIANLKQKTGHSLKEWEKLLKEKGPRNNKNWSSWLKDRHKMGTNTARFVAERAAGIELKYEPDAYVEAMFAAPRQGLRPIYEEILNFSLKLGNDVTVTPCKTIVPLRRRFVFAQVKPVSNTKIELGLALGNTKAGGPVVSTGGLAKGDRITHKIPILTSQDFGTEARKWLERAYALCPPLD